MSDNVSFNAQEFYSRQIVLPELGPEGQGRLRKSKVAVIGLGGLGTVSALYLTLAGIGYLRLVDQDTVELHNLHRQVLFSLSDLRYPKVEASAKRIKGINPEVEVEPIPENVNEGNIDEIIGGMNCIIDGLDNMRTRYVINRACVKHKIPYVFAGAIGFEGNLSVFNPPETPCLECVLPGLDDRYLPTCDVRGVLGATPGIVGSIEAMETIKLLAGIGETLKGRLLVCDLKHMRFDLVDIAKNPNCPVCQGRPVERIEGEAKLAWLCGRGVINVNPPAAVNIELDKAYETLRNEFKILLKSPFVVVFNYEGDVEVSLFKAGRMLIKNVKDEEVALKVYRKIIEKLGVRMSLN
jgi:adenylyltransferase/sulfurtransferase